MEAKICDFVDRFKSGNAEALDYPSDAFQAFIASVVLAPEFDRKAAKELCDCLLDRYVDSWYHGLAAIRNIALVLSYPQGSIAHHETHLVRISRLIEENKIEAGVGISRVFNVLEKVKRPTQQLLDQELMLPVFGEKKLNFYRVQFKKCWAEFLRCCDEKISRDLLIKILRIIPDSVIPHIHSAEIFASFFTECFNRQDDLEVSLLSVSGLFHLISKHNLGEPADIYSRMFQLIRPEIMRKSSQSNRVFQLLVKVIRSPLMPAQLVPVFAKRLLRVAVLVENPSMVLWLVVAAFNLMQAHPLVSKSLIHREDASGFEARDPFDGMCDDINAMGEALTKSSLWELELLMNHSDPSVVRMAVLFKTNFFSRKAKRISSDDYLLITDEQLFNRERKFGTHNKAKRVKGELELDSIIGQDQGKNELEIPIAVVTDEEEETLRQADSNFFDKFQKCYC
jgi:hypothetical protein